MKLVYKNIFINTITSILILFVGELSLYYFLKNRIEKETVEHLYNECKFLNHQLEDGISIDAFRHNIGDKLEIRSIEQVTYQEPVIEDLLVLEEGEEFEEEHRSRKEEEHFSSKKIVFDVTQDNKNYRVSITKTIDEDEGLADSMSAIIFISGVLMLLILITINIFVYHKLFSPIYKLIKDIKSFSVQQLKKITPPKTNTTEFITLGQEVSRMSEKMISDYRSIKEFTENMTHEIQTPLAVISSKIERCLQDKNLTEDQAILLSDAAKSVNKLFNINKGLTLLSKLENKQFENSVNLNLKTLLQQRIHYFVDFIDNKKLTITESYQNDITIVMKDSLAEILFDNLIKNAIQHNVPEGKISISIEGNSLKISNTGEAPKGSTNGYFDRFYSQKPQNSLGLGLSIIKKIVEYYNYSIVYNYEDNLHQIVIDFTAKTKTT